MKEYKAKKLLESFTAYCKKYPEQRFWQALCNWSGSHSIQSVKSTGKVFTSKRAFIHRDTFYWENKNN